MECSSAVDTPKGGPIRRENGLAPKHSVRLKTNHLQGSALMDIPHLERIVAGDPRQEPGFIRAHRKGFGPIQMAMKLLHEFPG